MKRIICSAVIILSLVSAAQSEPNEPNEPNKPNEPNAVMASKNLPLKSIQDCLQLSKKAGDLIQKGKFEEAFDLLHQNEYFVRFVLPAEDKKVFLTNLNAMIENSIPMMGRQIADGFEYIGTLKFNESQIGIYFLSKHQFAAAVWKFSFYKPEDEWKFCEFGPGPEFTSEVIMLMKPLEVK